MNVVNSPSLSSLLVLAARFWVGVVNRASPPSSPPERDLVSRGLLCVVGAAASYQPAGCEPDPGPFLLLVGLYLDGIG